MMPINWDLYPEQKRSASRSEGSCSVRYFRQWLELILQVNMSTTNLAGEFQATGLQLEAGHRYRNLRKHCRLFYSSKSR